MIKFNGTSDKITITDATSLHPVNMSAFCWFNSPSLAAAQTVICKPRNGPPWSSPYMSFLLRINSATQLECDIGNNSQYSAYSIAVSTISANQWHHIGMTYDGTTVNGWLDGVKVGNGSSTAQGNIVYGATPLIIGADYGASPFTDYFNGYLSDCRLYNRALNATEVSTLYKSKLKYCGYDSGLIGYWPLDEVANGVSGNKQTAIDRTLNNNNGLITGSLVQGAAENWLNYKQGFI